MKAKEIDYELMNEWFYYDETSPSGLRWKRDPIGRKRIKGETAGTRKNAGTGYHYWSVQVCNEAYKASRVVFVS